MMVSTVALSPPNASSRKSSKPRPFTLPSLVFFNIATSYILECSLLYSPLHICTLLYLLFPLLLVNLPPMLYVSCYIRVLTYNQATAD